MTAARTEQDEEEMIRFIYEKTRVTRQEKKYTNFHRSDWIPPPTSVRLICVFVLE